MNHETIMKRRRKPLSKKNEVIRPSNLDIDEERRESSDFPVVEGQFDDASSSPEIMSKFEDSNDELINRNKKRRTGDKKIMAGYEMAKPKRDHEEEIKEKGQDADEVKPSLVSFEESSPPKDRTDCIKIKASKKTTVDGPTQLGSTIGSHTATSTKNRRRKENLKQPQEQGQQYNPLYASLPHTNRVLPNRFEHYDIRQAQEMKGTEELTTSSTNVSASSVSASFQSNMPPLNTQVIARQIPMEYGTMHHSNSNIASQMPPLSAPLHHGHPGFMMGSNIPQGNRNSFIMNIRQNSAYQPLIQHQQELQQVYPSSITPDDVLLGRGGGTNRHNVRFRQIVSEAQPRYVQARKKVKTQIAKSIVATIRERNGRFLKLHSDGYYFDVGDKQATSKTSQALREGLSGRMREIVKAGGAGATNLRKDNSDGDTDDQGGNEV